VSAAPDLSTPYAHQWPRTSVHQLLGWDVWTAAGPLAWVDVVHDGDQLDVVLAESRADGELAPARRAGWASRTQLRLGADGSCIATHDASPSLLHLRHVGVEMTTVPRAGHDASSSYAEIEHGDVLLSTTPSFLQVAPAALLAQIPMRTRRRRSLAGLADDLVRRVGGSAAGERAAIVVAQRVWPASD
jgi:hypothetical protein